jgi:hypothetical protein
LSSQATPNFYVGHARTINSRQTGTRAPELLGACHPTAFYGTLPSIKTMKKLIWLLPLLIILGAMLVTVEMKSQTHEVVIQYDYGNLVDTRGRYHHVLLVLHPDGSVSWRDLTRHIR